MRPGEGNFTAGFGKIYKNGHFWCISGFEFGIDKDRIFGEFLFRAVTSNSSACLAGP